MRDHMRWMVHLSISLLFTVMIAGCGSTAGKESLTEYIDDSVITTNIKTVIYDDQYLKSGRIDVETFKGVVQLSGFVNSSMDVVRAEKLASSVSGVVSVQNSLVVQ